MVAAEYQEHFGSQNYDGEGNYIGLDHSEGQEAWSEFYAEDPGADSEDGPAEDTGADSEESEEEN